MKLTRKTRTAGWLAVAGLLGAALIAPSGAFAAGGSSPQVECAGYAYYFKIDSVSEMPLEEKTYTDADEQVETNWPGQEITISGLSEDGQAFDWESSEVVAVAVWKEGNEHFSDTVNGTSGSVTDEIQQGLSHVTFCGGGQTTTTTTDEETTDETTTDETTTDETTTESETTDETTSATTTGTISGETGKSKPTPPSTDADFISTTSTTSGSGWQLVLLAMAGLLAAVLLLTPATAPRKR